MEENEASMTKSVFRGGEGTTTEREFTEMWLRLINTLEGEKAEKVWP